MAPESTQHASTLPDGLVLTGQFLSAKVQEGRDRPDGGKYPDRFVVTVLVGDRTMQVEYNSEANAALALGARPEDIPPTERISLNVGTRGAKGYVFYYGANQPR